MSPPTRPAYITDLSDEQWKRIALHLVLPTGGAPKTTNVREVINAILYQLRTGCPWALLPHDFPHEGTIPRKIRILKNLQAN